MQEILYATADHFYTFEANVAEDVEDVLSNRLVIRGEIIGYAFLSKRESHYGSIGGNGAIGYNYYPRSSLGEAIVSMWTGNIYNFMVVNQDGVLHVHYDDHDGTHNCTIHPITKSRENKWFFTRKRESFEDIVEYIQSIPPLRFRKES